MEKFRNLVQRAISYLSRSTLPFAVAKLRIFYDWSNRQWERLLEKREAFIEQSDAAKKLKYATEAERIEHEPIAVGIPLTLYTLFALLGIGLLWAIFAELDQVVSGRGRLISVEPNIVLQPQETMTIADIHVRVGDKIKEGDKLVDLDPTLSEADRKQVSDRLVSIESELKKLVREQQIVGTMMRSSESASLDAAPLESKYAEIIRRLLDNRILAESEVRNLTQRLRHATEQEAMYNDLFTKQYISKKGLLDATDKRLDTEQQLLAAKNKLNNVKRDLASQLSALREDILSNTRERDSLQQQLVKADLKTSQVSIVAPRNAIVLEVAKLSKGSVARATEPLVTLVPADTPMLAEIQVSSSEITDIKVGYEVRVKLDAYPFQRYGFLRGKLSALSPDSVSTDASGAQSQARHYIARVEITNWQFEGDAVERPVLPGMTLTGEIITGSRSIISYLIDPITKMTQEAMTER